MRFKDLVCALGIVAVLLLVAFVHRWFVSPYAVWIGCDDAYITAFGVRMLQGHWLPYVDAVSHRGPLLYWLSAIAQRIGGPNSWAATRALSFLFAESSVVLVYALAAVARRPLAGFLGASVLAWTITIAMAPHDGIALNGEIVSVPFVLAGMIATIVAMRETTSHERRVWLAAATGALVVLGGLSKQPAFAHLLPLALWWVADVHARRDERGKVDARPLFALAVGAATPLLALLSFYARAGHLHALLYYFVTYNRKIYMAPITIGVAIESLYGFCRVHPELVILVLLLTGWWAARMIGTVDRLRSARAWLVAYREHALSNTLMLQALAAFAGACATFRFFDHYFVSAVPWLGLVAGWMIDEQLSSSSPERRIARVRSVMVATVCLTLGMAAKVHLHWLEGQRRLGFFGDPSHEPITDYIASGTREGDRIFTWGFAPEYYVSARRRPASRFVYTTFVAGVVPWFDRHAVEQEDALSVPGSRALLLRELDSERPELVLDVPDSLKNRSMRRYAQLAGWLESSYCYEATVVGRNGHTADVYRRKRSECARPMPPR